MPAAKKFYKKFASPPAMCSYAWLDQPDTGNKYSDNKYKVTIVLDKDDPWIPTFKDMLSETLSKNGIANIRDGFHNPLVDGDTKKDQDGNPKTEFAGKYLITFKTNDKPGLVDGNNKPLAEGIKIMSGDVVRAGGAMTYYEQNDGGITVYLDMVKLIEKRNMGSNPDDLFGDDDLPEGQTYEEPTAPDDGMSQTPASNKITF